MSNFNRTPVFVLTIKNSRREHLIKKRLNTLGINYKIFYAIDGRNQDNFKILYKRYDRKKCLKTLDMNGPGKIRVNKAGCLDRCEEGPVLVVYPEGIWYTYIDEEDIDEIVDSHLIAGKPVERLKI